MQDTYGWTLYLNGEFEAALRSLKPAAEALPDNPLVIYHLGMTYASLDETDLALEKLGRVVEMTEGDDFPHMETLQETMEAVRSFAEQQANQ
jgi:tetratricopeptide (TPR) repeat protein